MCRLFLVLLFASVSAHAADLGAEIARKHEERSGGRAKELRSIYAEGRTLVRGEVVDFRMWAERPNRLRIESTSSTRKVIQVYDGRHEPMISHSDAENGRPLRMSAGEQKDFIGNADFDGPLVDSAVKGYSVDYAGGEDVGGRPAAKLLVMDPRDEVFFFWIDAETAEVVKRSVFRVARDRRVLIDTFFSDFRPVAGTLQPHRVETKVGDNTLYLMIIARMEGNSAEVTAEKFAVPDGWPMLPREARTELTPRIASESRQP